MQDSASIGHGAHPAPHRERTRLLELIFVTLAPPLVWSMHLVVSYAVASRSCFPGGAPHALPSFAGLWPLLIAIDVVSLLISAAAVIVAYRIWRATSAEMAEVAPPMVETGEGRTRFLAVWGILTGTGFFVAVLFDFVGLWILPICS